MKKIQNFIGGELVPPFNGSYLENICPATGEVYSQVAASSDDDLDHAVQAAATAYHSWSQTSVLERSSYLKKIADLIRKREEEFALAESIDNGKPLTLARSVDIPRSCKNFEFFADAITQFSTECHLTDQIALNYTQRTPLGVVGCISPWNLPLYLLTWKLAPALTVGNTVVAKPSELTPMTASLLSEVCQEAKLPPGVLNIVHGTGREVGEALCKHPEVRAISFTGSTQTGAAISRLAAPLFKKLSLEMGGKNPTIIFADADFESAVAGTIQAAFSNQGQICLCGSVIFVEKSIYERFRSALIDHTQRLRVGDPLESSTQQGALVSKTHYDKILSYIDLARSEGSRILTGGHSVSVEGRCEKGWFIAPTLIEGLPSSHRINREEIFGPVASLIPFEAEDEITKWCSSSRYGLSASLWTNTLSRAHRLAQNMNTGMVWINSWMLRDLRTPFGGTKNSGVGREGGIEALRFFTEPKNICIKI